MYIAVLMLHQCRIIIYTLTAIPKYQYISFMLLVTSVEVHGEHSNAKFLLIF
jgi:hypothetical protein